MRYFSFLCLLMLHACSGSSSPAACKCGEGFVCVDDQCVPGDDVPDSAGDGFLEASDAEFDAPGDACPGCDLFEFEEAGEEEEIVEGGFLWPCEKNSDCNFGLCLPTLEGSVCTITCIETCPLDRECKYITPPGMEPLYACAPPETNLCRPCSKDEECLVNGEVASGACIQFGPQGKFCATECGAGDSCPDGFYCDKETFPNKLNICLPVAKDCPCLVGFKGLMTQCYTENEFGVCQGFRLCEAKGEAMQWADCNAKIPEKEICNKFDDNCNGEIDDGLGETTCGKGVCEHTVPNCKDGLPQFCNPVEGASGEVCDNLDNDCNGFTDENWQDKGKSCDGQDADECPNGMLVCNEAGSGLVCEGDDVNYVESCDNLDNDCDGKTDEVADLGETTCGLGVCNHTVANCIGGLPQSCNPMEGAEADDDPDPDFLDKNCDGMDGNLNKGIFVDQNKGKDINPGTIDLPKKSITAGIQAAKNGSKPHVYVSLGIYNETIELVDGVSVFGGYNAADNWSRGASNTTQILGGEKAVIGKDINQPTVIQGFLISSANSTITGGSSYGVFLVNSSGVTVQSNTIQAGSGGSGANGWNGSTGQNGSDGSNGNAGCEYGCACPFDCFGLCGKCSRPSGGSGGSSPCGKNGGKGGDGGDHQGSGYNGANGISGSSGGWGGSATNNGFTGTPGTSGSTGDNGSGGSGIGSKNQEGYVQ
ncbi:MAG: hypothetical protein FJ088_03210, partial [Deltaproteobacteria bacterium]|nr:hypothetical protein [Deltaproteobacteria bacterium]